MFRIPATRPHPYLVGGIRLLIVAAILAALPTAAAARAPGAMSDAPADLLPLDELSPAFLGMFRKVMEIEPEIRRYATAYDIDLALAEAVCLYESGGNAGLSSGVGAHGYFQVMPATFRAMRTETNIEAGIKYLAQLVRKFGREDYALAAYNGGPTRVGRGGPMPLESLQYVLGVGGYRSVLKLYEASVRHYAGQLKLATVQTGDTWASLAARLDLPIVQLRMHNPFLATRTLRPGYRLAYPREPRVDLFANRAGASLYRVRIGDNYLKLAFTLGIDPDALRDANGLWRLQTVLPGSTILLPDDAGITFASYTVRNGDELTRVAATLGVDPWWLIRDNAVWDESLTPGTVLRVRHVPPPKPAAPAPRYITHRVSAGENLTTIARRYHTTVSAIQRANGLGTRTRILVGQRLRVPRS